jgi:hypothetical protein
LDGSVNIENLAGRSPNGDLLVFHWTPATEWQVDNVSKQTGTRIDSGITSWLTPSDPVVEHLAATGQDGSPYVFWRSKGLKWQSVGVSNPAVPLGVRP